MPPNADLREQLVAKKQEEKRAAYVAGEAEDLRQKLERSSVKQKAAEQCAAAAERKLKAAEREVRDIREQLEEAEDLLGRLRVEAGELAELNARVESAKGVNDLFS